MCISKTAVTQETGKFTFNRVRSLKVYHIAPISPGFRCIDKPQCNVQYNGHLFVAFIYAL